MFLWYSSLTAVRLALSLLACLVLVCTAGKVYFCPYSNILLACSFDFNDPAGQGRWSRSSETRSFITHIGYGAHGRRAIPHHLELPGLGHSPLDLSQLGQRQVKAGLSLAPPICGSALGKSPGRVTPGNSIATSARVAVPRAR